MNKKPKKKSRTKKQTPGDIEVIAKEANVEPELVKKVAQIISIEQSWSGPLPPPSVLNQYSSAVQRSIVKNATSQMEHRHKIENEVIGSNIQNSKRGMTFAFIITAGMVLFGTFLIAIGKSAEGLASIFVPTGLQAGNFLLQRFRGMGKIKQRAEDENNRQVRGRKDEQKTLQKTN